MLRDIAGIDAAKATDNTDIMSERPQRRHAANIYGNAGNPLDGGVAKIMKSSTSRWKEQDPFEGVGNDGDRTMNQSRILDKTNEKLIPKLDVTGLGGASVLSYDNESMQTGGRTGKKKKKKKKVKKVKGGAIPDEDDRIS